MESASVLTYPADVAEANPCNADSGHGVDFNGQSVLEEMKC